MKQFGTILILLVFSCASKADVIESSSNGFVVSNKVVVSAAPESAYDSMLQVAKWWHPEHTWFGDPKNLSIQAEPGGCFCEQNGKQWAKHMTVVFVDRPRLLRLQGGLGPLQDTGLTGSLSFVITSAANGSEVEMKYVVGGFTPGGCEKLAPIVNSVLSMQLNRLKSFIDTGTPQMDQK